jgi:hypothetical protein
MQPYLNIKQKIGLYQSDNLENVLTQTQEEGVMVETVVGVLISIRMVLPTLMQHL